MVSDKSDTITTKETLGSKVVGTWRLVSWVYENEQGEVVHYFGEGATGILMYDDKGNMNAQLMKAERPVFTSGAISAGSQTETYEAFMSYLAYYGKYYEPEPGVIIHLVEGSLFPNWLGDKQKRYARIDGDFLIISTPPIAAKDREITFYITWKRDAGK